jgi:hypothetical protein
MQTGNDDDDDDDDIVPNQPVPYTCPYSQFIKNHLGDVLLFDVLQPIIDLILRVL